MQHGGAEEQGRSLEVKAILGCRAITSLLPRSLLFDVHIGANYTGIDG